jgi:hypothetical protein
MMSLKEYEYVFWEFKAMSMTKMLKRMAVVMLNEWADNWIADCTVRRRAER